MKGFIGLLGLILLFVGAIGIGENLNTFVIVVSFVVGGVFLLAALIPDPPVKLEDEAVTEELERLKED